MVKKILWVTCVSIALAGPAWAQNPCTVPLETAFSPTKVYVELADYDAVIETTSFPVVTEVIIGDFLPDVDPAKGGQPIASVAIARQNFTLVAGTRTCYETNLPLTATPTTAHFAAAKSRRSVPDVQESAWSPLSNPFVKPVAPQVPGAVRRK